MLRGKKSFCCTATFSLDKSPGKGYIAITTTHAPKEDVSMDPKKVVKQTFDFYKSTFENTYNAMTMLQEQSQKMVEMYLDQTQGFPEEGKKAVQEWINAYKKGGEDFKAAVDESFKKVEDFFAEAAKSVK
jgi:polyhydroxyalkanoate synthesis regulator phasin